MKKHPTEKDHTLCRLVREARPIWKWLLLGCLISIVMIACSAAAPKLLGGLIDRLYDYWDGSSTGDLMGKLTNGLAALLVVYTVYSLLFYLKMLLLNNMVSRYFTCTLRIRISDKIRRLPVSYVDQTPVGDVLSRMTDDVSTMGNSLHQIIDTLMSGFLMLIAIAGMMLRENWLLAVFVLIFTPASIFLSTKLSSLSEKHYHEMFTEMGNLNSLVEESFTNFATTKAYHLEDYAQRKHAVVNKRRADAEYHANFIASIVRPVIVFSNALAYILICLIGGWLIVNRDGVSVGIVVTILLYARQFSSPLEQIANGLGQLQHTKAACRRVFKLLDLPEETDADGKLPQ